MLGFSSAFLDDAEAGSAAIDDAVAVAELAGEPEALGEAYLRRAELLTGPLNRLVEGVAYARDGVERMRALGLAYLRGRAADPRRQRAVPAGPVGRGRARGRADVGAGADGRRGARRPARALPDHPGPRPAGRGGRPRGRRAALPVDVGPRQRIPLLVLFAALELWRRDPARALRHEDGLALAEAGAGHLVARPWRHPRMGRPRRGRRPGTGSGQVDRLPGTARRAVPRATTTVPAVRAVVDAFAR